MSTWKQVAASKYAESSQLNETIRLRQENTKMRIEMEGLKAQLSAKDAAIAKLNQQSASRQNSQAKINQKLSEIALILDFEFSAKRDSLDLIPEIIHKIKLMRESKEELNRTINEMSKNVGGNSERVKEYENRFQAMEKDLQSKEILLKKFENDYSKLTKQNELLKLDNQNQGEIAASYSHKLTSFQTQKKEMQIEIQILRQKQEGNSEIPKVKKQVLDLLNKFNVRDDDNLKSYLKKNELFKNGSSGQHVSKKNKYDFIFDN